MPQSPCYHCSDRRDGCHGTCRRYRVYWQSCEERREKAAKRKQAEDDAWALRQGRFRRRHKNRRETKEDTQSYPRG